MLRTLLCVGLALFLCASGTLAEEKSTVYTPQFSTLKTERGNYWILDHSQKIALVRQFMIGLFRQFPEQAVDEKKVTDAEIVNHWFECPGLRLWTQFMITTNLGPSQYLQDLPGELSFDSSDPKQLTTRMSWKKSAEEFGSEVVRVQYDQELGRYVVHVEADLQINQPGGGEYCNFYPQGLGDFRPGASRYDRLIFQEPDGQLKAHYLSVQKPQPGPIRLPPGGLVGFVNEPDGNPVVIVEESTPRTCVHMCLCWFDAHLFWDEPYEVHWSPRHDGTRSAPTTFVAGVPGPPYCYHVKFKAYWLNAAETSVLLAKAETVPLTPFAKSFRNYLPIEMNGVNDFENTVDFASGKVKRIYFPLSSGGQRAATSVTHDTTVGHSGHSSIRFISKIDKGAQCRLMGPELIVTPGRQVKISAWVKTADITGEGFYLESGFLDGPKQLGPLYRSAQLTGTNDWTLLEIPLPITPPETQFLGKGRITFHLSGQGTAWVDDFVFGEQEPDGPPVSCRRL
jgi:hypothetical protein